MNRRRFLRFLGICTAGFPVAAKLSTEAAAASSSPVLLQTKGLSAIAAEFGTMRAGEIWFDAERFIIKSSLRSVPR